MAARDVYLFLVRIGGTVLIVFAYFDLFHIVLKLFDLDATSRVPLGTSVIAMVGFLAPGLILIVGAERITRLVYGRDESSTT